MNERLEILHSRVGNLTTDEQIELNILLKEPENLEAIFNIAETFELKGDKTNAVIWYQKARDIIKVPDAKIALDKRIMELKK